MHFFAYVAVGLWDAWRSGVPLDYGLLPQSAAEYATGMDAESGRDLVGIVKGVCDFFAWLRAVLSYILRHYIAPPNFFGMILGIGLPLALSIIWPLKILEAPITWCWSLVKKVRKSWGY